MAARSEPTSRRARVCAVCTGLCVYSRRSRSLVVREGEGQIVGVCPRSFSAATSALRRRSCALTPTRPRPHRGYKSHRTEGLLLSEASDLDCGHLRVQVLISKQTLQQIYYKIPNSITRQRDDRRRIPTHQSPS